MSTVLVKFTHLLKEHTVSAMEINIGSAAIREGDVYKTVLVCHSVDDLHGRDFSGGGRIEAIPQVTDVFAGIKSAFVHSRGVVQTIFELLLSGEPTSLCGWETLITIIVEAIIGWN